MFRIEIEPTFCQNLKKKLMFLVRFDMLMSKNKSKKHYFNDILENNLYHTDCKDTPEEI